MPDALVKAIDVDLSLGAEKLAAAIFDELLSGDRCTEVGFTGKGRTEIALEKSSAAVASRTLDAQSVVVVTGGAKGVGLTLAKALAAKYRCAVAVTGRTNPGEEVTASLKAAGARAATWHVMDAKDPASVKKSIDQIRATHGRIDALVHAAGILSDGLAAKKDVAQFAAVIDTKALGALSLLEATRGDKLVFVAGIGSWAGRFGNAGQTDYAAGNAMLSRLFQSGAATRGFTIDFPPFEDSAMAKKIPSFKKAELRAQGVTFLTDAEGTAAFLKAVETADGEVLVGRAVPERSPHHRASFPVSRLNHVYLNDHEMAGQRVLPLAAAVDHLAAAAVETLGNPQSFTVSDLTLKRTILVPDTTWLDVEVRTKGAALDVSLHQGAATSYQGTVSAKTDLVIPAMPHLPAASGLPMSLREFYDGFTFHGPKLQGIVSIEALGESAVSGWVKGCVPSDWVKEPLRSTWTVDPLVLDSSFQLAGYWAWVTQQRAGFPVGFRRYTQLKPFGLEPVKVTAWFEANDGDNFKGTLVWQSESGELLAVMEGAEAEFKKRDPQFVKKAAPAPAPVAETAVVKSTEPDESTWNPAKFPEYEELKERIAMAEGFGLKNPYFSVHEAICGDTTVVDGQQMINFSSYNYVGNSGDPVVSSAAKAAIDKYGTSVSASRVASGEKPLTLELERELARFFGTEAATVFVSGHATNVTVVGHMAGAGDLVLHDALAHDSIIQGAKLSGAKRRPFPHNDWEALDRTLESLRGHYRRVLICIEGTYSMDGDIPDLPKFIEVKKKHKAMLLVDEAHSAGVVGKTGRGIGEYHQVNRADVDLWMGTMSKSFASCGGYICGSKELCEYLKYTTPGFVYSVGLAPPNAASCLASLKQLEAHPERVSKLQENARYFVKLFKERGIDTGLTKDSAVVPAIIGNSFLCLQVSDALKKRGVNVQPILYPAVEEHLARLRFFVSSLHSHAQLEKAADILSEELKRLTREMEAA